MNYKGHFDFQLILSMLKYSSPMLLVGLAYVVNETLDRAMLKEILYNQYLSDGAASNSTEALKMALSQNGIYGANYKITMVISMFIQSFRYASEPFFFKDQTNTHSKENLSKVMNYFTIVLIFIFLIITLYLQIFKYFIPNKEYWEGLKVIPILLSANICLGIYTSLAIWYKLSDKTIYGALISIIGVIITLTLNYWFIPSYGYIASAYATLCCYGSMMIISYLLGQYYYPVPYKIGRLFIYITSGGIIYTIHRLFFSGATLYEYGINTLLLIGYIVVVYFLERPKKIIL